MSQLYFTHWELDSRISKVEKRIIGHVLKSLLVDAIIVEDWGKCEEIYTNAKLASAIAIAV